MPALAFTPRRRRPAPPAHPAAPPLSLVEVGLAGTLAIALLLAPLLGSLGPVVLGALLALLVLRKPRTLVNGAAAWPLLLAAPAFALASILWSVDRGATLHYGALYAVTIALGLAIATTLRRDNILVGFFYGWALYAVVNLVLGQRIGAGAHGETAFSGLTQAKNFFGDTTALGAMVSMCTLLFAWRRRAPLLAAGAFLVLLVQLYEVRASFSTGSMLGVLEAAVVIALFTLARFVSPSTRTAGAIGLALCAAVVLVFQAELREAAERFAQDVLHKDPTLTGRTVIWDFGQKLVQERPLLGVGFYGFWRPDNIDAQALWNTFNITGRVGFNFHNTPLEILVELGWAGLATFAVVLLLGGLRLVRRTLAQPEPTLVLWCAFLAYELARMPYEAIGLGTMSYTTVLLAAALVIGEPAAVALPGRIPSSSTGRRPGRQPLAA